MAVEGSTAHALQVYLIEPLKPIGRQASVTKPDSTKGSPVQSVELYLIFAAVVLPPAVTHRPIREEPSTPSKLR